MNKNLSLDDTYDTTQLYLDNYYNKTKSFDGAVVANEVLSKADASYGYDAQNNKYGDMFKAGIVDPGTNISVAPFVKGTATFGEANPAVKNSGTRSITLSDNGSTTLDLNMGLVNWVRGVSPEYGTNIRPRNFVA